MASCGIEALGTDPLRMLVLFGEPGSGKETVGKILEDKYGLYFHNGNDDYPPEMKQNIKDKVKPSEALRDEHARKMIASLDRLRAEHQRVALKHVLPLERQRLMIRKAVPDATFLLVVTDFDLKQKRVADRHANKGHHVTPEYAAQIHDIFEEPTFPHLRLVNNDDIPKLESAISEMFPRGL